LDNDHGGILKINPLIEWSYDQVWTIRKHNLLTIDFMTKAIQHRCAPYAGGEPRKSPRRALVVGKSGNQGMRPAMRGAGEGI
jgi:3'-phosphoadenosine 5'-phosphosulfate sulfotransferase (PAPS reductase)/FAD synthetase